MFRKLSVTIAAVSLLLAPSLAFATDKPLPTAQEQEFYREAYGHSFSPQEHEEYLSIFGSVPTPEEVRQYVASSEAEQAELDRESASYASLDGTTLQGYWSSDLFSYGRWIGREVWALSLMPSQTVIPAVSAKYSGEGWVQIYNRFNGDRHWSFYKSKGADRSMRKQYLCHVRYGSIKVPWNIEPSKPPSAINDVTCN